MAVADAAALAEVLLARLDRADLGAAALAPYERARRPANERSIAFSRRASRIIVAARRFPVLLGLLGPVARGVARSTGAKDRMLRALATSFVGDAVELGD
jgi:2-polyprenyl-6-methoxyphenol hydroxylase-like FAD-dependent oxidoreductase